jgi:hypothetical protein|tara:strand:+ start:827 stop:1306 length:480 start_codon:yes stop_codon:yes gene_type:complete
LTTQLSRVSYTATEGKNIATENNRPPTALEEQRLLVPEQVRQDIKKAIRDAYEHGYRGQQLVQELSLFILSEMLAGNIQPDIAREARGYVEIVLTSITAQALAEADKANGTSAVAKQLAEARKKIGRTRPQYLLDEDEDGNATMTVELVNAEESDSGHS